MALLEDDDTRPPCVAPPEPAVSAGWPPPGGRAIRMWRRDCGIHTIEVDLPAAEAESLLVTLGALLPGPCPTQLAP